MSGHGTNKRQGGRFGRGPDGGLTEKPKDFKGTWKKLLVYCKRYLPVMIAALVLAGVGTVLQIMGPNQLGKMTDEILKGLPALIDGVPVIGSINFNAVRSIAF